MGDTASYRWRLLVSLNLRPLLIRGLRPDAVAVLHAARRFGEMIWVRVSFSLGRSVLFRHETVVFRAECKLQLFFEVRFLFLHHAVVELTLTSRKVSDFREAETCQVSEESVSHRFPDLLPAFIR